MLVVTAAALVIVARFLAIDAASHSASDTLRPWLLQAGGIAAIAALLVAAAERLATCRSRR